MATQLSIIAVHGGAADLAKLVENGYAIPQHRFFDTEVAARWCWPDAFDCSLEHLALRLTTIEHWRPYGKLDGGDFDTLTDAVLARRCAGDAEATLRLYPRLSAEIDRLHMRPIFNLGMDVLPILAEIGGRGMAVDDRELAARAYGQDQKGVPLRGTEQWLQSEKESLQADLGVENVDSDQQLAEALYVKQGAEPLRKTTTGVFSVDHQSLLWARYQARRTGRDDLDRLLTRILEYNVLAKLYSTYYKPWTLTGDGLRVRSIYSLGRTATGRLCVAEGTTVEIVRDLSQQATVKIEDVKSGDLAITFDSKGYLTTRRVLWAGCTGTKKVIRLHWESGTGGNKRHGHLDVTPDHLIRLVDGSYKKASDLAICTGKFKKIRQENRTIRFHRKRKYKGIFSQIPTGDNVLAVSRFITAWGYSRLRYTLGPPGGEFEHKVIMGVPFGHRNIHVHHKNGNKLDNRPENLEVLSAREHLSYFSSAIDHVRPMAAHRQGLLRKHLQHHLEQTKYPYPVGYCNYRPSNNHRIIRVEELPEEVKVYDIEVEETNNFIANELCVHNSAYNINPQNIPGVARELIIPSPGYDVLVSVDYKQLELCVAGDVSQDETLCQWVREGVDIHARQAARVLHLPEPKTKEDYTQFKLRYPLERQIGKRANFATLFLVTEETLAWQVFEDSEGSIWIPPQNVKPYIDAFFTTFPGWKRHVDRLFASAMRNEWIVSKTGRRWAIHADDAGRRKMANYPVQSLASDLVLLVLKRIAGILKRFHMKTRIIAEVHDSLVFETTTQELNSLCRMVQDECLNPRTQDLNFEFTVPLSIETSVGTQWGKLTPYSV